MATKLQEMQRIIRQYRFETGHHEVDMREVAKYAVRKGWPLPKPRDPIDRLMVELTNAARVEYRYDDVTKQPYRVNHAIPSGKRNKQGQMVMSWFDIDDRTIPRAKMVKSLTMRREQMVDDGVHLSYDQDHWNRINPDQEAIQIPFDFTDDIAWRKNAPADKKAG